MEEVSNVYGMYIDLDGVTEPYDGPFTGESLKAIIIRNKKPLVKIHWDDRVEVVNGSQVA